MDALREIDLEVGIPELVRNGDLCAHQDHVILSAPTTDALTLLDKLAAPSPSVR